jgi:hypothetical protein
MTMREPYGRDPNPVPGSRLDRLGKRQRAFRRKVLRVVLVVASIAVVGGLVAFGADGGDGVATRAVKPGGATSSPTGPIEQRAADTAIAEAVAECRTAWKLQSASRAVAKRSLAQWRVHIDAMNKLTAGQLTLDQAKQFWAESRTGASANAAAFRVASRQYRSSPSRCQVPPETEGDVQALAICHDAEVAANKELASATAAITTWETHIHHMEQLRAGQLDPTHALHLWLQNWRAGAAQVAAYDKATVTTACTL